MNVDSSGIRDLAVDFSSVPARATRAAAREVSDIADTGMRLAQSNARVSAGAHGVHYPKSITSERVDGLGLAWVYGPDSALRQGGMSFEFGSRNQPPHLDLNRSADAIGPDLRRVAAVMSREVLRG